jgi:hypothetical protein
MRRFALPLIALWLTGPALAAAAGSADAVVVDPLDLRRPVPDPEEGLTAKYDGKTVRFTGTLARVTADRKTKKPVAELNYTVLERRQARGQPPRVVSKETVIVVAHFQGDEKMLRGQKSGTVLTVEGQGSVMVDGTLVITGAVIVPDSPFTRTK